MKNRIPIEPRGIAAVFLTIFLAATLPLAGFVLTPIASEGDPAPSFPKGTTITFIDDPRISDGGYVVFEVQVTGGTEAIYRWDRSAGLVRVAVVGDAVDFATGPKTLSTLVNPIVDEHGWVAFTGTLSDGQSGMVVWQPNGTLHGVAEAGEPIEIPCESAGGENCGPVPGILRDSLPQFVSGTIFHSYQDTLVHHEVLFEADTATEFLGNPDAVWRWSIDETGAVTGLHCLASDLMHVPEGGSTSYYDGFTELAACDDLRVALVGVAASPSYGVVELHSDDLEHGLLDRSNAPDTLLKRQGLHCRGTTWAYLGGRSTFANDGDATKKGVWIGSSQVYSNSVTPAAGLPGATLGLPIGQALTSDEPPASVFAAHVLGSPTKVGVWRGTNPADLELLVHEGEEFESPSAVVDALNGAYVGTGVVVYLATMNSGAQAILRSRGGIDEQLLTTGVTVQVGDESRVVEGFSAFGSTPSNIPNVFGGGEDGRNSALNDHGEFALLVHSAPVGGGESRTSACVLLVDPLFADSFESEDVCGWSFADGAPTC